jgi:tetratricopeptide (TPR) repeat protein
MKRRGATAAGDGESVLSRAPLWVALSVFFLASVGPVQAAAQAQPQASAQRRSVELSGTVVTPKSEPVAGARVTLREAGEPDVTSTTNAAGVFRLTTPREPRYEVRAETFDHRQGVVTVGGDATATATAGLLIVVAPMVAEPVAQPAMEFADKPDFTVAGITDWTAVGGHGSDATLRTSEDMARQTAALTGGGGMVNLPGESAGPGEREYKAALACRAEGDLAQARQHVTRALGQADRAEFHRLAGELDEQMGDPLGAAQEEERAAALDPSEQNYFTWGSELLLHRAIWQAAEVFAKGAKLHPESQRLKMGWGAALFAGAKYDDAATRLCAASDLDPANRETYIFLGKLGLAAPSPEPCVNAKLARFVQLRPDDVDANYYQAMMLLKAKTPGASAEFTAHAETFLERAVRANPRFAEGYLQLGILASARRDDTVARADFERAIAADPTLAEAHYRLGVLYDRTGHPEQAKTEFARHEQLVQEQADAVEQQRRQVKQFLVVLGGGGAGSPTPE